MTEINKYKTEKKLFHNRNFIWITFFAVHTVLSMLLAIGLWKIIGLTTDSQNLINSWIAPIIIFNIIYLLGWTLIVSKAWTQVEEKWEYILEIFGSYTGKPLRQGLQLIFPYFDFMFISAKVFMGTQRLPLYLDEKKEDKSGGGAVDFQDGSAPVSAKVFFRITDSARATYEVDDVINGVEEKIDAALRAYLSKYTIDEASELKTHFDTDKILNGIKIKYDPEQKKLIEVGHPDEDGALKPDDIRKELKYWGVEIESIIITDIILSGAIRDARRQVLEAQKAAEAATHTAEKIITLAKANKEEKKLDGEGYKMELGRIIKTGVKAETAISFLQKTFLYENIGNNAVIIESGNGSGSGEGAKFGAAFRKGADVADNTTSKPITKTSNDEQEQSE